MDWTIMMTRSTQILLVALALAVPAAALAAPPHAHAHDHRPLHGGVVVEVRDVDYELVASKDELRMFLRDHGKPMDVGQVSARLTLLTGTERQDVSLLPAGTHLEARGSFRIGKGTKVVAAVSRHGKTLGTVRFDLP
ncbi:hypothetical protein [Acidovorax lacteus]|uniref:DUF5666 domain-containing protein n=1 Tax=Acidovorax lacteus TaxID=1924988 RepID=A0ABP8L2X3_9BURK